MSKKKFVDVVDISEKLKDKRYLVIGDIHGCYDELQQLLDKAKFGDEDILISVGDLTDRGFKNKLVLQFCMDLYEQGRFYATMGNHDDKLTRYLKGNPLELSNGLRETVRELKNYRKFKKQMFDFVSKFPYIIKTPVGYVVHAGFSPVNLPEMQFKSDCLYMRYYGGRSYFDHYGGVMWYRLWPEHFPTVFFGHHPHDNYGKVRDNVFSLDGGCVFGGNLVAFDSKSGDIVSVKAAMDYTDKELK